MSIWQYIKDQRSVIISSSVGIIVGIGLLALFHIDRVYLSYVASFLLLLNLVGHGIQYFIRREYYRDLAELRTEIQDPLILPQLMESANFYEAQLLRQSLAEFAESYQQGLHQAQHQAKEYRDYLELWIHEVKNPLASAHMLLANRPDPKLQKDLSRIEAYLDQALYYARASSVENDYIIQPLKLSELIDALLKKHADRLIEQRFRIERENLDLIVKADSKWLLFILEQLLDNAIKYRGEQPLIRFYAERLPNSVRLSLWDNGLGIAAQDLPRVFEKSFTGQHGRHFERSTGIGLYLCRLLCQKLGLSIQIQSQAGAYTQVQIDFPIGSLTEV